MVERTTKASEEWLRQSLREPWSSPKIAGDLNEEVLRIALDNWHIYDTNMKVGVMFAFLCIPRADQTKLKDLMAQIFERALQESGDWPPVIAQILKDVPDKGRLNFDIEHFKNGTFDELLNKVRMKGTAFYPPEFVFLDKEARNSYPIARNLPPDLRPTTKQHFILKEKHTRIRDQRLQQLNKVAAQAQAAVGAVAGMPSIGSSGALSKSTGSSSLFITRPGVSRKISQPSFLRAAAPPKPGPINTNATRVPGMMPTNSGEQPPTPTEGGVAHRKPLYVKSTRVQVLDMTAVTELEKEKQAKLDEIQKQEQYEKDAKKKERADAAEQKKKAAENLKAQKQKELEERREKKRLMEEEKTREKDKKVRRDSQNEGDDGDGRRRAAKRRVSYAELSDDEVENNEDPMSDIEKTPQQTQQKFKKKSKSDGTYPEDSEPPISPSASTSQPQQQGQPTSPMGLSMQQPWTQAETHKPPSKSQGKEKSRHKAGPVSLSSEQSTQDINKLPVTQSTTQPLVDQLNTGIDPDTLKAVFEATNALTPESREAIMAFLKGRMEPPPGFRTPKHEIVMNVDKDQTTPGETHVISIVFEMNFAEGTWKKLKRKKIIRHSSSKKHNADKSAIDATPNTQGQSQAQA